MLYITEDEVKSLLTMDLALDALDEVFRARPTGAVGHISRARLPIDRGSYNLMAGSWREKGVVGQKSYVAGANGASFHVMLYSTRGEGLLAVIEANHMGQVRTGAASGIATRYMARSGASTVGIIGSGNQAATQLEAIAAVRQISSARVFSRTADRRERFAATMSERLNIDVQPTASAAEAVDGVDIVITITNASEPVLTGDMLSPGTHINAAGSNSWMRRELDTAAVGKCGIIATDDVEQARIECGELMRAAATGHFSWETLVGLDRIVAGLQPGRDSDDQITLFESQGVAFEDIAVCNRLYKMAKDQGIGATV